MVIACLNHSIAIYYPFFLKPKGVERTKNVKQEIFDHYYKQTTNTTHAQAFLLPIFDVRCRTIFHVKYIKSAVCDVKWNRHQSRLILLLIVYFGKVLLHGTRMFVTNILSQNSLLLS